MSNDPVVMLGLDHVEYVVGNARQAAHHHRSWGFIPVAYAGLETGYRDRASWCVSQGDVRLVFTAPITPQGPTADHLRLHGDGISDIAFSVHDAEEAFASAVSRGAREVSEPFTSEDEHGKVTTAVIGAFGDTVHSLVSRRDYSGAFLPGYAAPADRALGSSWSSSASSNGGAPCIKAIDHFAIGVEVGMIEQFAAFYRDVFGFGELYHFSDDDVSTEYSALMSKVVGDQSGVVRLSLCEPAPGRRKSQIEEFLDFNLGPGVQHVAFEVDAITRDVASLGAAGVEFLTVPTMYYEELIARVPQVADEIDELRKHSILADRDEEGYLLQIFSKSLGDRPTLFYELIERHGSRGFGAGNFRSLFEALEREQAARGNL